MTFRRLQTARMPRRTLFRNAGFGAAGLGAMALVGCGDDDDDDGDGSPVNGSPTAGGATPGATTAPTQGGQARAGGTLRLVGTPPTTLDILTSSNGTVREFGGGFYPTLIQPLGARWQEFPASEYQANLADLPEQPEDLVYTFKINPQARWADPIGRPVTAGDVVYSLDRFLGKSGAAAPQAAELAAIDTYEASDDETITIRLSRPFGTFLVKMSSDYTLGIMPEETGSAFDPLTTVVSAGPWLLDSFDAAAGSWRVVRNPEWFMGPDRPYLDAIESSRVPEYANQLVQFQGGNIDQLNSVNPGDLQSILDARNGTQLRPQKGLGFTYFGFGEPRDGSAPWADPLVRQAISLALDRDTMMPIVYDTDLFDGFDSSIETGTGGPLDVGSLVTWHNVLPAGFPNQSIDPREDSATGEYVAFNVADARARLDAAGFPDGFDVDLNYNAWSAATLREVELAVQQLSQVGINVNPVLQETAQYIQSTYTGDYSGLGHFLQGYTEHSDFLTALYATEGGRNHSRVQDEDIRADVIAIQEELDTEQRYQMTRDIHPKLAEEMWYVPAVAWQIRWDVFGPEVQNIYDHQTYRGGLQTVERTQLWMDA